jgi:hypothetical protein
LTFISQFRVIWAVLVFTFCAASRVGYDEIVVDQLANTVEMDGYDLQTLVVEIVTSCLSTISATS